MKKDLLLKNIAIFGCACLAIACTACEKEGIIEQVKDNYVHIENTTNINGELFCLKNNILDVRENFVLKTADNDVKSGVLISSDTKNANLYYARAVDLRESNSEIISFEVPYTDTYQTAGVEIKIVDIYDESNTVTVRFGMYEENSLWSVVSAKNTEFNSFAGYNTHALTSGYQGQMLFPYNNFVGIEDTGNYHYAFNLCYDATENQVYLKLKGDDTRLICDFDDEYFTRKSRAFQGFTSDKVYVNVKFTELVKNGAVFVQSIGGQSLAGDLDYTLAYDNIKIENNGKGSFYEGAVGYKYSLPKPIETDFLMGVQKVELFVEKLTDNSKISVDSDYSFVPNEAGLYKAIYNAKDLLGNDIKKEIEFSILENPKEISIDFEDKNYEIGDKASLPAIMVAGGSGETSYSVSYEYNENVYTQVEEIEFIDLNDLVVKVTATDSIGYKVEKEQAYSIAKKELYYLEDPLVKAAKIGEKLVFPSMFAYDYINDVEMKKTLYVNGVAVENNEWIVQATDGNCLIVEYFANEGAPNERKIEGNIRIFDQSESYFLYDSDTVDMAIGEEYTAFKAKNSTPEFSVSYPYPVSCEMLNISVILGEFSRFDYLDIRLVDYVDGTSITYRLKYENGGMIIRIKDETGAFVVEKLITNYLEKPGFVNVYYNNNEQGLFNHQYNEILKVAYTDDGHVFEGFYNGGVYVDFTAVSVQTDAEFRIEKISNQGFFTRRLSIGDKTAPVLSALGKITYGEKNINDELVLPRMLAFDVLTGEICPVTLTMYSPSGVVFEKYVLDNETTIKLDEFGSWICVFESVDSSKQRAYLEETITVVDDVLPTIITSDFVVQNPKIGSTIEIPTVKATDNISGANVVCYALVRNPNMQYAVVDGNVTLSQKGEWKVVYYARDAAGNIAIKEFTFFVQ